MGKTIKGHYFSVLLKPALDERRFLYIPNIGVLACCDETFSNRYDEDKRIDTKE